MAMKKDDRDIWMDRQKDETATSSPSAGSAEDATPLTDRARRPGDSITLVAMCRELEWENAELRKGLHAAKQLLDAFKAAAELDMTNVKGEVRDE